MSLHARKVITYNTSIIVDYSLFDLGLEANLLLSLLTEINLVIIEYLRSLSNAIQII